MKKEYIEQERRKKKAMKRKINKMAAKIRMADDLPSIRESILYEIRNRESAMISEFNRLISSIDEIDAVDGAIFDCGGLTICSTDGCLRVIAAHVDECQINGLDELIVIYRIMSK